MANLTLRPSSIRAVRGAESRRSIRADGVATIRRLTATAALLALALCAAGCNENTGSSSSSGASALATGIWSSGSAAASVPTSMPVVSGEPTQEMIAVGQPFHFAPTAAAPDGRTLAFVLMNAPAFLSIDAATGVVTGTPASVDVGSYPNLRVVATDGAVSAAGPAFALTVVPEGSDRGAASVTGSLSIAGAPITAAVEGVAWSFRPVVTVVGATAHPSFRVANAPRWATFDAATGTLAGTPPVGSAGSYANIVISVSDSSAEAALRAFTLSVSAQQQPSISGTPGLNAPVGIEYAFHPRASISSGARLVFTISGKPSWASFDPLTGRLAGTPAASDAGSASTVTISATDGVVSRSLPAFTLSVGANAGGTAALSWVAPTQRTNGALLTNLAGYRVYYGTAAGAYVNSVSINNPNLTSYTVDGLPPGTFFFVTTAFDAYGNESGYSNPVSKTIG